MDGLFHGHVALTIAECRAEKETVPGFDVCADVISCKRKDFELLRLMLRVGFWGKRMEFVRIEEQIREQLALYLCTVQLCCHCHWSGLSKR